MAQPHEHGLLRAATHYADIAGPASTPQSRSGVVPELGAMSVPKTLRQKDDSSCMDVIYMIIPTVDASHWLKIPLDGRSAGYSFGSWGKYNIDILS
jgi:hypothetical protein